MANGRAVLRSGADKVTVNTAALERPQLISELSQQIGAQAVVLSLDVKRNGNSWQAFTHGGRQSTGRDAAEWAVEAVSRGAGEILVTSIDKGRHAQRFRLRTHGENCRKRFRSSDRFRRSANTFDNFLRCVHNRMRRRRAGRVHFSRRNTFLSRDLKHFYPERGVPIRMSR